MSRVQKNRNIFWSHSKNFKNFKKKNEFRKKFFFCVSRNSISPSAAALLMVCVNFYSHVLSCTQKLFSAGNLRNLRSSFLFFESRLIFADFRARRVRQMISCCVCSSFCPSHFAVPDNFAVLIVQRWSLLNQGS